MADSFYVVYPHCDTINRIPRDRPALRAKCARCGAKLFDGRPVPLDAARF
jgi:thioredoxin 2